MTSIVYTDEGGQEQSLVGKIVYTTDESGTGNIIIQVVAIFSPEFWIRIPDPDPDPENQFKTESGGSGPFLQYCNSS